ncbi:MAG: hypothetical protein PVI75_07965 [Gammaproteobacteria bacterium]|jgi:hypothetical protein
MMQKTSLVDKLSNLKLKTLTTQKSLFFSGKRFLLSNENYMINNIIESLKKQLPKKNNKMIHIGMLVGESHLLSLLSELKGYLDVIIVFDINPKLHQYIKFLRKILESSKDVNDFIAKYTKQAKKSGFPNIEKIKQKVKLIPKKYFFLTKDNFALCQQAIREIKIVNVLGDFFDTSHVKQIQQIIESSKQYKICFLNITNLKEYAKKKMKDFQTNLNNLSKDKPIIMYSGIKHKTFNTPITYPPQLTDDPDLKKMKIKQEKTSPLENILYGSQEKPEDKIDNIFEVLQDLKELMGIDNAYKEDDINNNNPKFNF